MAIEIFHLFQFQLYPEDVLELPVELLECDMIFLETRGLVLEAHVAIESVFIADNHVGGRGVCGIALLSAQWKRDRKPFKDGITMETQLNGHSHLDHHRCDSQ